MTPKDALTFVQKHGIVLESARGPVMNLAEAVAGSPIRGSWWAHPRSHEIFHLTRAMRASPDVLVCRLIEGKVTYVHRRLWPVLARVAEKFAPECLAAIRELHRPSGKHQVQITPFDKWLPTEARAASQQMTEREATAQLGECLEGQVRLRPRR